MASLSTRQQCTLRRCCLKTKDLSQMRNPTLKIYVKLWLRLTSAGPPKTNVDGLNGERNILAVQEAINLHSTSRCSRNSCLLPLVHFGRSRPCPSGSLAGKTRTLCSLKICTVLVRNCHGQLGRFVSSF